MSKVYVLEPPTKGKVLLRSTVGDIDIELWSKECPIACRNFIQHCMDNFYDNTIFHRVVQNFIIQGGDPTGTGNGGNGAFGTPFKDEFHSRLRFNRRGLIGVAKIDNENGSQFFITLGDTPELDRKHTLFGKVAGNTIFNVLRIADGEIDETDRPVYPHKIISTEVIINPFPDILPRDDVKQTKISNAEDKKKKGATKVRSRAIKNFGLLSFGEEAEHDASDLCNVKMAIHIKAKTAHDINDPDLLDEAVSIDPSASSHHQVTDTNELDEKCLKLSDERCRLADEVKVESNLLQKEIIELQNELKNAVSEDLKKKVELESIDGSFVGQFNREALKISDTKEAIHAKKGEGRNREDQTLDMLSRFKRKMDTLVENSEDSSSLVMADQSDKCSTTANVDSSQTNLSNDNDHDLKFMFNHELESAETSAIRAFDANRDDDPDRYDIYDPRNPLNKRRREMDSSKEEPKLLSSLHRSRFSNNP